MAASFPPNAQAGVTAADLSSQADATKGSALVGFLPVAMAQAVGRSLNKKVAEVVSVKDFGAVGDGVADDTAAIRNAMTATLSLNGGDLFFPPGTYLVSGSLDIALWTQWRMRGASRGNTTIKQATDNTPIFRFTKENAWGWAITDLSFTWSNAQAAANTAAVAILVDVDTQTGAGVYNALVDRVRWDRGYRGFAVSEVGGTKLAWGVTFDNIVHGSLMTGAIISVFPNPVSGSPNLRIGHVYARADSATEALIRLRACSGFSIENFETNVNNNGQSLLQVAAGCSGRIGVLRCETATYAAARNIVDIQDTEMSIDSVRISTMTVNAPGASVTLLGYSGGAGHCQVGVLSITGVGVTITAGSFYAVGASPTRRVSIGSIDNVAAFTALTNIAAGTSADGLFVADWDMRRVSADNGDAAKVLAFGDSTVQMFETTLTAARIVTLPPHLAPSNAYNGAWFRIVRNAAAPGAFVLSIRNAAGAVIKDIPAGTSAWVEVAYRRSNWVLIGYGTL